MDNTQFFFSLVVLINMVLAFVSRLNKDNESSTFHLLLAIWFTVLSQSF